MAFNLSFPNWIFSMRWSKDTHFLDGMGFKSADRRETQPTPPPHLPSRLQNLASYPRGLSSSSLTDEFSWHQVSVRNKKSRSQSVIRAEIEASLLLIEWALSKPHLVPFDVALLLGLAIANLWWRGLHNFKLNKDFLVFLRRGSDREFNWSNSFLENVFLVVDAFSGMRFQRCKKSITVRQTWDFSHSSMKLKISTGLTGHEVKVKMAARIQEVNRKWPQN